MYVTSMVQNDLGRAFPESRPSFLATRVLKYRRATPLFRPGTQRYRVPIRPRVKGLYLAGDHTDTGLPATIEGAILSGYEAGTAATDYLAGGRRA